MHVEALQPRGGGLPAERMRLHICWGNYEDLTTATSPLRDLIDILFRRGPPDPPVEAANPRHARVERCSRRPAAGGGVRCVNQPSKIEHAFKGTSRRRPA